MNFTIRQGDLSDLGQYTVMMQKAYTETYVNESIGLTTDCFSLDVFNTEDTQNYLKSRLVNNDHQKCWVALNGKDIVGAVTVKNMENTCEMSGFYVDPTYQGKGVGKLLWSRVLKYAAGKDITLDIYTHNIRTIELYKHWGFEEDTTKPRFFRHWPEWPDAVRAESMYMRRKKVLDTSTTGMV